MNNELNQLNFSEKKKNNSGTKIFIGSIILLILVLVAGFVYLTKNDKKGSLNDSDASKQIYLSNVNMSIGDNVITYIPLDDRPVNVDRVQYLAGMAGYELAMPNKAYYSTFVSMDKSNTKAGNPKKLAEFLLKQEADGCDYYIISLDQLFSGGLMSSRAFLDEDFEDGAVDSAFKALEYILSKKENKVYLFDTTLRLATSSNYYGFSYVDNKDDFLKEKYKNSTVKEEDKYIESDYDFARMYNSAPRKVLEDKDLTKENLFETYTNLNVSDWNKQKCYEGSKNKEEPDRSQCYSYTTGQDENGNKLHFIQSYELNKEETDAPKSKKYSMSDENFNRFIKIRERKINLFERYIKLFGTKKAEVYLTIGGDDSSNHIDNVQRNDLAYVKKVAKQYIKDFELGGGVDDAALTLLTRLAVKTAGVDLKLNLKYYTNKDYYAGYFGPGSIGSTVQDIMNSTGVSEGTENDSSIDVLIWSMDYNVSDEVNKQRYHEMIDRYISNIKNGRLTIIIDVTDGVKSTLKELNLELISNAPLGYLLSYSSWNTSGNTIGIALSQGIVRYLYLASNQHTNEADFAFLKSLTFDFVKDLGYKRYVAGNSACNLDYDNPSLNNLVSCMNNNSISHVGDILTNLKNSNYITDIDESGKLVEKGIADVAVNNYHFPWYRKFEMSFDIKVDIKDSLNQIYLGEVKEDSQKNQENNKTVDEQKQKIIENNKKDSSSSKKESSTNSGGSTKEEKKTDETKEDKNTNNNNKNNNSNKKTYTKSVKHYAYIDLTNGGFDVNGSITRAEFAKWLCRANNISPVTKFEQVFTDVNRSTPYWQYIVAANKAGYLVGGGNSKYRPDSTLTRAEAVTAILRVAEQENITYTSTCSTYMSDVSSSVWYYSAMRDAAYYCILEGDNNKKYNPTANVTKAELTAIIYRALQRSHDGYDCDLSDANPFNNISTSHWAYPYLVDAYKTHTCKK